jgi:hypothetical protein
MSVTFGSPGANPIFDRELPTYNVSIVEKLQRHE